MKQEKTKGKGGRGGRVLVERREGERETERVAFTLDEVRRRRGTWQERRGDGGGGGGGP